MTDLTNSNVEQMLRSLRTAAPEKLEIAVLTDTGLADAWTVVTGPTGPLIIAFNQAGVSGVAPLTAEGEFRRLHVDQAGRPLGAERPLPTRMAAQLDKALETGRLGTLPVDLSNTTDFQRAVLLKTVEIPPGEVRPYSWVAREIDNPGAVRAVGTALSRNPVPVIIPCHRVARSDGSIGEYAYGPEMKRALLSHEGVDVGAVDDAARRGITLTGSDTTHIYCFPTCRHARRTKESHRVEFKDRSEAEADGYRPCKVCRPAVA